MEFDLSNAIAQTTLDPWDFVLNVGGVKYPTRPLSVADVDALRALPRADDATQRVMILGLFDGEKRPPIDTWDSGTTGAAIAAIIAYQRGRLIKNSQAVAKQVFAAVTEQTKGADSKT